MLCKLETIAEHSPFASLEDKIRNDFCRQRTKGTDMGHKKWLIKVSIGWPYLPHNQQPMEHTNSGGGNGLLILMNDELMTLILQVIHSVSKDVDNPHKVNSSIPKIPCKPYDICKSFESPLTRDLRCVANCFPASY